MPSVGMRRSTRVFGARVLRSGRRLWMEPYGSNKHERVAHVESKCVGILEKWADKPENIRTGRVDEWHEFESNITVDLNLETIKEGDICDDVVMKTSIDKMFGLVYTRKRKHMYRASHELAENSRFGNKYARREWKKRCRAIESFEMSRAFMDSVCVFGELGISVDETSYGISHCVSRLLFSLISYITRFRIGIRRLYKFLLSKPLFDVYSSLGLQFFQDSFICRRPKLCIISGSRSSIPLLHFTSPTLPSLFMHLQTSIYFRFPQLVRLCVSHSYEKVIDLAADDTKESYFRSTWNDFQEYVDLSSEISSGIKFVRGDDVASENEYLERWKSSQLIVGLSETAVRSMQSCKIQKRRSSLGRRKGVSSEYSDLCVIGRPRKKSWIENTKELKYTPQIAFHCETARTCCATLLVTDADKCHREEGIMISLESTTPYCFLAIKKEGIQCYSLIAQKVMKPSISNRFTHSIVWGENGDWKLEFLSKKDWMIFKELYKECFERNTMFHAASVIPVPRVRDVCGHNNSDYVPFVRPLSYITMKSDELSRALENKHGNYDMDSDDERWLTKLNGDLYEGGLHDLITPDSFELVINDLEKGHHCSPDDNFGDQAGYEFCEHVANSEVFQAIQNYWIQKRKQKRSALIRVFQLYQPRRTQVIPKSILRKKRSFKRQGAHRVNDKQVSLLQEISREREAIELENNARKVHNATAVADRLEEFAILNRQKAQSLMVNADLITYKALMALRIAEAAQMTDGIEPFTSIFLS